MKIEPVPTNFRRVATSSFLVIPKFQRPYSWTNENIEEFWNDLLSARDEDYFIGSFVFYEDKKDKSSIFITDGQQRLSTLTIALCALRDVAHDELSDDDFAKGIQNIIERKDVDNKNRFVIKHSNENKFLAKGILKFPRGEFSPATEEEKRQQHAYNFFYKKIVDKLKTEVGIYFKSDDSSIEIIGSLRNTILNMTFITLTLQNEDDAYLVFETLNSRGKDLEISDLLKNLFSRLIPEKNKDISISSDSWNEIRAQFESVSTSINFDSFLLHYWLSTYTFVSKKNLFKEMKKTIGRANAPSVLKDVERNALLYLRIAAPKEQEWDNQDRSVMDSLDALNKFSVQQTRPLVLAILKHHYHSEFVSNKQVARSLSLVESFTFQFNAITQSRGGGGVTNMYSRLARECNAVTTDQDYANFYTSLRESFRDREIDDEEFLYQFKQLNYTNEFTRDRALIRYILIKLRRYIKKDIANDTGYTIEHLHPQSGRLHADYFGNIGNLWIIPDALNAKLGNKSFDAKMPKFIENNQQDSFFDAWDGNPEENITSRADALSQLALQKVWPI